MSGESWWAGGVLLSAVRTPPPHPIQLDWGPMALQGGWGGGGGLQSLVTWLLDPGHKEPEFNSRNRRLWPFFSLKMHDCFSPFQ